MAYVLSPLCPQSPVKRSFSDNPPLSPCMPLTPGNLTTFRNVTPQNLSATSLTSLKSPRPIPRLRGLENAPPLLTSRSLLNLAPRQKDEEDGVSKLPQHLLQPAPARATKPPPQPDYFSLQPVTQLTTVESLECGDSSDSTEFSEDDSMGRINSSGDTSQDFSDCFELYDPIHIALPPGQTLDKDGCGPCIVSPQPSITIEVTPPPFKRWMSTLRRRHAERRKDQIEQRPAWPIDIVGNDPVLVSAFSTIPESLRTHTASVSSSFGFVTAVKSASITIASSSIAPRSDGGGLHSKCRIDSRSSHFSEARRSADSHMPCLGPIMDEGAWLRSLQRRKIIEELITSEESYIADLKVLINDYFMLLASVPTLPEHTRASIHENISQILQLHQDLLNELQLAVPHADITQRADEETYPVTKAKHIRFHSADMMPGRFVEHKTTRRVRHSLDIGRSPDRRPRALVADTRTVGLVAKIFNKYMNRFFAYEEYGAHWTTMSQDLTSMCRGMQGWQEYERGVEALSKVLASENNREASSRKALSFSDLLIKPIQRVCKYPLLFDDLCRHTPVYDDPEAHAELEKALFRLQEAIQEVNKAKDDPKRRRLIETTWYLQDRLVFQEQAISRALVFRLLGHVLLCGVLHAAYQGHDRVKGQYMICVLYKSCLVLATTNRSFTPYTVVAAIPLGNGSLEEPDNGRGLQCHTAPYTWKLVFEHNHRLHEIIFSACSSQEEQVWKTQLRERISSETHDLNEGRSTMQDMFSSLSLDIKSIGPVFGNADSLIRRMSVHRSATIGPKPPCGQVIIKNTQAQKSPETPTPQTVSPNPVTRSQSTLSTSSPIPTLAPRRAERMRLETALAEVWTKDLLPYPGMGTRRTENPIRASANSVMRKLSMASIASNFSRRSPSLSSPLSHTRSEESFGRLYKLSSSNRPHSSLSERRPVPAVVDFHTAPTAFLPADFELQDTRPRRRKLPHRAFSDRPSEKPAAAVITKPKRVRRVSTHMISLPRTESHCNGGTNASDITCSASLHSVTRCRTPTSTRSSEQLVEIRKRRGDGKDDDGLIPKAASLSAASDSGVLGKSKSLRSRSRIFKFWT